MNLARQFLADWVGAFDWGLIERLERVGPLGDLDRLVGGKIAEILGSVTGRPGDRQSGDALRVGQASVNSSRSGPNSFGSSVRVRFSFSVRLAAA
jgi:hypothetical protein